MAILVVTETKMDGNFPFEQAYRLDRNGYSGDPLIYISHRRSQDPCKYPRCRDLIQ